MIKKFGVNVNAGQYRRAKNYVVELIIDNLVDHSAKLWSYSQEMLRTNLGSTVKLKVDHMHDGKNYFSKFYMCFDGGKQSWIEGYKNIISLGGCFLKGICKGGGDLCYW